MQPQVNAITLGKHQTEKANCETPKHMPANFQQTFVST